MKMIYVDIKGNLGNQLFEYAFAKKIQKATGQDICLNTYFLKKYKPEYLYSLGDFNLPEDVLVEEKHPLPFFANSYTICSRVIRKISANLNYSLLSKFGIFMWLSSEYKKIKIGKHRNYYISGYWQSAKYFAPFQDEILDEFKVSSYTLMNNTNIIERNEQLYNLITSTESVCITIRRGDYVSNKHYKKKFLVCDEQYFLEAMEKIIEDIPNATFFMFSDDVEWVRNNIPVNGVVTYYESGKDPVWEKLRLMSACKHFIISNSSFSWWAQYLSSNGNKIVYAPSRWYADGATNDLYSDKWKVLKV
ncbi:alpha-1,2-fucosyltransferase [Clostridium sp. WB02_MRS01]|nr:alpha-1,2-fucosyltransferase [Clostridium sp. WB02_MRS01]